MLQFRLNPDGKSYTCMGPTDKKSKDIVIPQTYQELPVTKIDRYAFENCKSLKSIVIPDSITKIGDHAFAYCPSLKSIVIPNNVTEIANGAFINCYSLESVNIPNSVTRIDGYAFSNCSSLKSINIPNSITRIYECAFYWCISLEHISIPDSVTEIGNYAFYYCRSLKSITIPNSVTKIGNETFFGCAFTHSTRRFKVTKADNSCRNFIYEIGKWCHEDNIKLCSKGFHSCKSPLDIFNYYRGIIGKDIKLYEVATKNESNEKCGDSKVVSQDICLLREISISELADIASGRV